MNIVMMLRSIAPAISPKNSWKRLIFRFSSFFYSAFYGTLLLPLMLLTTTAGIRVYSRGIAGFIDQRTAFTHAEEAILQSRDFNLGAEGVQKFLIHEANISKTEPVTLPF